MKLKLQLPRPTLLRAWGWASVFAAAVFAVLNLLDGALKVQTGYGTVALQFATDGVSVRTILDRWQAPMDAGLAGFLLGFDFLFIPLYGAALYFGAVAARELLAPKPGGRRRLLDALTVAPLLAAVCDCIENVLEFSMLLKGPTDLLATLAFDASMLKWAGLLTGVALSLMAAMAWLGWRQTGPGGGSARSL